MTKPPVTPEDFVAATAGVNAYEIMAAHVALITSRNGRVRALAQQMRDNHEAALVALRQAAVKSGLAPPTRILGADQAPLLAALQSLAGVSFDRAYIRQQLLVHQAALVAEQGYARAGTDANLRGVAQSDVSMIERHLLDFRQLGPV